MARNSEIWLESTPGVLAGRLYASLKLANFSSGGVFYGEHAFLNQLNLSEEETGKFVFYMNLTSLMFIFLKDADRIGNRDLPLCKQEHESFIEKAVQIENSLTELGFGDTFHIEVPIPVEIYQEATKELRQSKVRLVSAFDLFLMASNKLQWADSKEIKGYAESCFYTLEERKEYLQILKTFEGKPLENPLVVGQKFSWIKEGPKEEDIILALSSKKKMLKELKKRKIPVQKDFSPELVEKTINGKNTCLAPYFACGLRWEVISPGEKRELLECFGLPILYFRFKGTKKNLVMLRELEKDYPELYSFIVGCLEKRAPGFSKALKENPLEKFFGIDALETLTESVGSYLPMEIRLTIAKMMGARKPYPLPDTARRLINLGKFYPLALSGFREPTFMALTRLYWRDDSLIEDVPDFTDTFNRLLSFIIQLAEIQTFLKSLEHLFGIRSGINYQVVFAEKIKEALECLNHGAAQLYSKAASFSNRENQKKQRLIKEKMPIFFRSSLIDNYLIQASLIERIKNLPLGEESFNLVQMWGNLKQKVLTEKEWKSREDYLEGGFLTKRNKSAFKRIVSKVPANADLSLEEIQGWLEKIGALSSGTSPHPQKVQIN